MSSMLNQAQAYLGQSWIGTNSSDKGQCVGLFNKVVLDVTGLLYPLQGAQGAKDLITCTNTRPDLFQQIKNNPNDPNQLPQVGDWIVWGSTWGGGYGHVACAKTVTKSSFTSIEQNFVANKVTEQWHDWNGVIGWVRYLKDNQSQQGETMTDDTARQIGFNYLGRNGYDGRPNALAAPQPDLQGQPLTNQKLGEIFLSVEAKSWRDIALPQVYADRDSLRTQVVDLTSQLNTATAQVKSLSDANTALSEQVSSQSSMIDQLNKEIAQKDAEIAKLKEELANAGKDITINFNFFGIVLWTLISKIGKKK